MEEYIFFALACSLFVVASFRVSDAKEPEITIFSYNIYGLPWMVAGRGQGKNVQRIYSLLDGYDIVLLQENFIHQQIMEQADDYAVFHRNDSRFSFKFLLKPFCGNCGSGLTAFMARKTDLNVIRALSTRNVSFGNICAGWIGNCNNCFVTKGFQVIRLLVDDMPLIVYNTHLDAGWSMYNVRARQRQLAMLQQDIATEVQDTPLIIAGDFNADRDWLSGFVRDMCLATCPIKTEKGIDHIFYRNRQHNNLRLLEATVLKEFFGLSDHMPLYARFRISHEK